MDGFTDLTNRFSHGGIGGKQLQALKDHVKEYFIVGQGTQGLVNLRLDIVGDESLSADSDITDHYVESNIAYQDQISLKPKIYTIQGEVGELVWYQKDSASQVFGQVAQRLEGVVSFLPIRSKSFNQMKTKAMKALQWVDTASNAVSKISNLMSGSFGSVTHQQQAYQELVAIRDGRKPVNVQTPWGILKDYAITNLKLTQPKETKDKSIISITFKEFRTTSISKVAFDASKYQGNAVYENAPEVDNGKSPGNDNSISEEVIEKDAKKYITYVKLDETNVQLDKPWYFKMEWTPNTDELRVYYDDNTLVTKEYAIYPHVIDAAKKRIANNISQGVWKK